MRTLFRWLGMPFRFVLVIAVCVWMIVYCMIEPDGAEVFVEMAEWVWEG